MRKTTVAIHWIIQPFAGAFLVQWNFQPFALAFYWNFCWTHPKPLAETPSFRLLSHYNEAPWTDDAKPKERRAKSWKWKSSFAEGDRVRSESQPSLGFAGHPFAEKWTHVETPTLNLEAWNLYLKSYSEPWNNLKLSCWNPVLQTFLGNVTWIPSLGTSCWNLHLRLFSWNLLLQLSALHSGTLPLELVWNMLEPPTLLLERLSGISSKTFNLVLQPFICWNFNLEPLAFIPKRFTGTFDLCLNPFTGTFNCYWNLQNPSAGTRTLNLYWNLLIFTCTVVLEPSNQCWNLSLERSGWGTLCIVWGWIPQTTPNP